MKSKTGSIEFWAESFFKKSNEGLDIKKCGFTCLFYFTLLQYNITIPSIGHQGVRFKHPTEVGFKNPSSPAFRVGWHALLIRVKYSVEKKKLLF